MTNGAGATAAAGWEEPSVLAGILCVGCEAGATNLEEPSVFAGIFCVGCEAGAAIGVLTLAATEGDSDWRGSAEGAESTCDVEVSVR